MALTKDQMLDVLWKKVMYGFAATDIENKDWSNETITSPLALYGHEIWAASGLIPETPPAATTAVVEVRTVQCVADPTVEASRTWVAVGDPVAEITQANRLRDWIPPSFGVLYTVVAYAGDPAAGGTLLYPQEEGLEWVYDYPSGVLHFPNGVPEAAKTAGVWLAGYRYAGAKGVTAGGGAASGVQVYQGMLNYSGQTLDSVSGLPADWTVEITDATTCTFRVTHPLGKPPVHLSFFGQGPSVGTAYRLRNVTTYTELLYDTAAPNRFTVSNATPFATGAQSSTNTLLHIFF